MSLDVFLSDGPTPAPVAAVVVGRNAADVPGALDALDQQVYEPAGRFVLGGDPAVEAEADSRGITWVASVAELLEHVPTDIVYLWVLHDASRPRPTALQALVTESYRVDASIAGSKLLLADNPKLLLSVGMATDVFDVPYTGLDPEEMDQDQYEVVRDVAAISGASMLVRRDLMRGLGGVDRHLAPDAASIDFCQRARLRGARVVIVPSSEVLYPAPPPRRTPPWKEEAGRIRAMLKVYGLVSLLWVLPFAFVTGLVEAVVAPFFGRWTLFNWARAWLWNVVFLPSTLIERRRARRGRVVGEGELFRYQLRGSARMRALGDEGATWLEERFPERAGAGFTGILETGQETMRSPGFVAAAVGLIFAFVATRAVWAGSLPTSGFSLPPSDGAMATLRAYAGGWNVAGLGSPEPLHPSIGAIALIQRLALDRPELTAGLLTLGAFAAGVLGMARLLRHWGLRALPAYLAGVVLMGGPATQALAGRAEWTAVLALGVLPWVVRVALREWPKSWRGRIGRIAALGWLTAVMAAGLPALLVVPTALLALWALFGHRQRWWAPLRAAAGGALAVPMLFPWFGVVSLTDYLRAGTPAYWDVWWPIVAVVGVAALAVLLGSDRMLGSIAGWGATAAGAGLLAARAGDFEAGRDVAAAGMIMAALGTDAIAGAAMEAAARIEAVVTWRKAVTALGVVSGVVLVASVVLMAGPGRAGLPKDEFRSGLQFTSAQQEDPEMSRVLLAGPAETLPGESRRLDGAPYRVVSAPLPRLWEARLAEPRLGDAELEATLRDIVEGRVARAGEALAPFGIKWVVLTGPSPFADIFDGQLDLVPLAGLSQTVFLSEVDATRVVVDGSDDWEWTGPDYAGPALPGRQAYLAENADQRWGPGDWEQEGWANRVALQDDVISFEGPSQYRRETVIALSLLVALLVLSLLGTGRKAR